MGCKLFTDSDTYLPFNTRAKAFLHAFKKNINNYCIVSYYDNSKKVSVYNTFLKAENGEYGKVLYFDSEAEALKHIGSFL